MSEVKRGFYLVGSQGDMIPERATYKSAGSDFYVSEDITIPPHSGVVKIPTGVSAKMEESEFLMLAIRSSLSIRGLSLANGVGIVDSDFFPNEIKFLVRNLSSEEISLSVGDRIGQGIFMTYLVPDEEDTSKMVDRTSGFGSTGV